MKQKTTIAIAAATFLGIAGFANAINLGPAAEYNPQINPADFTTEINSPYYSLPIGKKMVYEAQTEDGLERIELLVPGWTREVMGVKTLILWDRVWVNNELIEDTRDYLAQHKNGDLWYFGEHVDNYENGKLVDHHGAWLAGIDNAKPGIWMLANPKTGDEFRNEYYAGEAEDITKILAVNENVPGPLGTHTGCVKTFDWSPISPATANKYFCKGVGGTVLEVELVGPDRTVEQRVHLVEVDSRGAKGVDLPKTYAKEGVMAGPDDESARDDEDSDDYGEWGGRLDDDWLVTIWVVVGLILGILIQKFVFKR